MIGWWKVGGDTSSGSLRVLPATYGSTPAISAAFFTTRRTAEVLIPEVDQELIKTRARYATVPARDRGAVTIEERAALAAILDTTDGVSAKRAAAETGYSHKTGHSAFDRLDDIGLIRVEDG